jgi:hypothetical protein
LSGDGIRSSIVRINGRAPPCWLTTPRSLIREPQAVGSVSLGSWNDTKREGENKEGERRFGERQGIIKYSLLHVG